MVNNKAGNDHVGLDFGPPVAQGHEDCGLFNAGRKAVTLNPGAFFHHAASLAMMRGGPLDVATLGTCQFAQTGAPHHRDGPVQDLTVPELT